VLNVGGGQQVQRDQVVLLAYAFTIAAVTCLTSRQAITLQQDSLKEEQSSRGTKEQIPGK